MIFEREAGAAYSASAVPHKSIVYPVRTYTECDLQGVFGRVYRYHTRGIFSGRTDIAEASGTGIEVVPNQLECSAGYSGRTEPPRQGKYPRYTLHT